MRALFVGLVGLAFVLGLVVHASSEAADRGPVQRGPVTQVPVPSLLVPTCPPGWNYAAMAGKQFKCTLTSPPQITCPPGLKKRNWCEQTGKCVIGCVIEIH